MVYYRIWRSWCELRKCHLRKNSVGLILSFLWSFWSQCGLEYHQGLNLNNSSSILKAACLSLSEGLHTGFCSYCTFCAFLGDSVGSQSRNVSPSESTLFSLLGTLPSLFLLARSPSLLLSFLQGEFLSCQAWPFKETSLCFTRTRLFWGWGPFFFLMWFLPSTLLVISVFSTKTCKRFPFVVWT